MSHRNIRRQKGFTLIELMIAVSIFVMIFIMGADFVIRGYKSMAFESEQEAAVKNARRIMELVTKEIREINLSARGDYPISTTSEQSLAFYSDADNDGSTEKIRYFLSDRTFKKGAILPGASLDYSGTENITSIADYINNQTEPLFFYYDSDGATSTTINDIRLIKVKLKVNVTPNIMPNDYYLESDIQLRNLKDNL